MVRLLMSWRFFTALALVGMIGTVIGVLAGAWLGATACAGVGIGAALEARRLRAIR